MAQVEGVIRFKDSPFKVFYTGSTIHGEVDITLSNTIDIHGIKLIISGRANVFLSGADDYETQKKKNENTECIRYMAKQEYFETITYIFGSDNGYNQLNKGYHFYEFSYNLPMELPSSVEGHFGRVRYYLKAVIEYSTPNKSPDAFTTNFIVHKVTDLNYDQPMIRLPTITEIQEQFLCWPCSNKPIIMQSRIPQSGYVCGQNIPVTVNITNKSGEFVHQILISLHLIMKYHGEFPRQKIKIEEFTVKKIPTNLITNSENEVLRIDLPVPPLPPTCLESLCRIIQVTYEIRIRAFVKGSDTKLIITHPIVIGNIPLRNIQNNPISKLNSSYYSPKNPEIFAADIDLHPPTYEEACYIRSKKLPEYPVYNFNPSTARLISYLNHC